jgi:CBS domain-containing protein
MSSHHHRGQPRDVYSLRKGETMRVEEIMNAPVFTCAPESSLEAVARQMQNDDCGVLLVVDEKGKIVGIITDRDLSRALGREGRQAAQLRVSDAMTREVFTCRVSDEIDGALEAMGLKQVRRLPVLSETGALRGILSMDDVVIRAEKDAPADGISYDDVVGTYRNLCSRRLISRHARLAG